MRGAVVIETALTVGIGLTILLFAVQVGALGFLQVTADAASYTAARAYAVGVLPSTSPAAFVHNTFPQIAATDITSPASPSPAPSAPLAVEYEYDTPSEYGLNGQRHAGQSMLQPLQVPAKVIPHGKVSLLGRIIGVGAQDVEAQWTECTPHFNTANTPYAQCGAAGNPAGYNVNYFTGGENTPPYFVGFNFMQHCPTVMPWTTCGATAQFLSLGIGAFLDTYNWGVATPGVNGANAHADVRVHGLPLQPLGRYLVFLPALSRPTRALQRFLLRRSRRLRPTDRCVARHEPDGLQEQQFF